MMGESWKGTGMDDEETVSQSQGTAEMDKVQMGGRAGGTGARMQDAG